MLDKKYAISDEAHLYNIYQNKLINLNSYLTIKTLNNLSASIVTVGIGHIKGIKIRIGGTRPSTGLICDE